MGNAMNAKWGPWETIAAGPWPQGAPHKRMTPEWRAEGCCCCCCSVVRYVWLCTSVDCSTPGLPVHHQPPQLAQTHVHRAGDAIQPSHPLSLPSPPALDSGCYLSQSGVGAVVWEWGTGLVDKWVTSSRTCRPAQLEAEREEQEARWDWRGAFMGPCLYSLPYIFSFSWFPFILTEAKIFMTSKDWHTMYFS